MQKYAVKRVPLLSGIICPLISFKVFTAKLKKVERRHDIDLYTIEPINLNRFFKYHYYITLKVKCDPFPKILTTIATFFFNPEIYVEGCNWYFLN